MRIDPATQADIVEVARDMREQDFIEFAALTYADTREELAHGLANRFHGNPNVMCARRYETPIAIGGALEIRPNVLTLLFFSTKDFEEIALPLTRFMKQRFFPPMIAAGVHRIEAISYQWHLEAHRWIESLGLEQEATIKGYGKNRETFIQFSWTDDVCKAGHGN